MKIPKCPRCKGAVVELERLSGIIYGSCLMCSREFVLDLPLDGSDMYQVRPVEPATAQRETAGKRYQRTKKGVGRKTKK